MPRRGGSSIIRWRELALAFDWMHCAYTNYSAPITNRGWGKTMKQRIAILLVIGVLPWAELHAQSQQASTTFRVSALVEAVCEVTATDPSVATDFSRGTPLQATTLLRATCTPGSTYHVGQAHNTGTVTGVGTGLAVDHTVFGAVPAAQVIPAGDYQDTITVRIYY